MNTSGLKKFIRDNSISAEKVYILLGLFSLVKLFLYSLLVETPVMGWEWEIKTIPALLFSNASILGMLFAPGLLFKSKRALLNYGFALAFLISLSIVVVRTYYLFFHGFLTPATILHSPEGLSMSKAVLSIFRVRELLWAIDLPILKLFLSKEPGREEGLNFFPRLVKSFKVFALSFLVFALSLNMGASEHYQENVNLRESGLLLFYLREASAYMQPGDSDVFEEDVRFVKEWFEDNRGVEEHSMRSFFGRARGKNLIVLQVEALQEIVIDKTINGQEITPHLNRIKRESIYFNNCFDQVDMATADAEALVNLSLYPLSNESIYMRYPDNKYNSLAHTLRENNYRDAAAFHGFRREFYNREEAYPNLGFNKYFSRKHFRQDEMHGGLLGDKTFLRQTADRLEKLEEPYYSFIITLTSHHPFNYLEDYDEIDVGEFENTIIGDYISSIHYTDAAVGEFYELLEKRGILDDSLLVIYGDHVAFNYNEVHWEAQNEFFGADMSSTEARIREHRVPLFIRLPGVEDARVIESHAGMIDIYPTVANILGVESEYVMGRDLLNTPEGLVVLKDASYIKGEHYFYAPTQTLYNLETGGRKVVEEENDLAREAREALEISEMIFKIDFFRKLEKGKYH